MMPHQLSQTSASFIEMALSETESGIAVTPKYMFANYDVHADRTKTYSVHSADIIPS